MKRKENRKEKKLLNYTNALGKEKKFIQLSHANHSVDIEE